MHLHTERVLRHALLAFGTVFLALLVAAIIGGGFALADRLAYELQSPFTADSPLYWAVGRGVVNGLVPYRDLFETKPPGIFLVSSLSFWLTDDIHLASVAQALILLAFPFLLGIGAVRAVGQRSGVLQTIAALVGFACGTVIALYTGSRSGEFQVESFGAVFATLYAVVLAWHPSRLDARRIAIAAASILLAVLFKEPFLLVALAVALLLRKPADLPRSFLLPAVLAGVSGVLLLLLLGYLQPYVDIYLDEMLGRHIHGAGPLWQRALRWQLLLGDLWDFSVFLPLLLGTCGAVILLLKRRTGFTVGSLAARSVQIAASFSLLALAVGMGGQYFNHHFAFAVPGIAAFFLASLARTAPAFRATSLRWVLLPVGSLASFCLLTLPRPDYAGILAGIKADDSLARHVASAIDATLDACGQQRYLFLGTNGTQPYGYTRHSPLGPLFFQYDYLLSEERAAFRESLLDALDAAPLVVLHAPELNTLSADVEERLREEFSHEPWPCAVMPANGHPYTFHFRRNPTIALEQDVR